MTAARLAFFACAVATAVPAAPVAPMAAAQAGPRAGAATVDITPPAGFAAGGHSKAGAMTRGQWGSLRATAFYMRDGAGQPIVLVSCDLFAIPSVIHQEVARRAQIPLERLIVSATHTHHGPGNFLGSELYNRLGSRQSGYDPALREFLVARIVEAIAAAARDAETHPAFTLDIAYGSLPRTLLRNRSPRVFMANANRASILAALGAGIPADGATCSALRDSAEPEDAWDLEGCPRLRAVDRGVILLRIRRGVDTAALGVFMAAHPTVLPAATPVLSPDVFGFARGLLEEQAPIVAFFNGAEGDITTRRTARDAVDVVRLAQSLAASIRDISSRSASHTVDLAVPTSARLRFARPGETADDTGGRRWTLASTPLGGRAVLGGAEDDGTLLAGSKFARQKRRHPVGEHGVKLPALWGLTRRVFPTRLYPQALPLSVIRLGGFTIAAVPSEISTAAGVAVREEMGVARDRLALIGLANEYASYAATIDEYQEQDYMGASTLWGPQQAGFFAAVLGQLRGPGDAVEGTPGIDDPGPEKAFGPARLSKARVPFAKGLEALMGAWPNPARLPHFTFCTAPPAPLPAYRADRVAIVDAFDRVVDRDGVIVVLDRRPSAQSARWTAIWAAPLWYPHAGAFRFRISGTGGVIESAPFDPKGPPPPNACGIE